MHGTRAAELSAHNTTHPDLFAAVHGGRSALLSVVSTQSN